MWSTCRRRSDGGWGEDVGRCRDMHPCMVWAVRWKGVQRVVHYWDWQWHHQCIPSPTTHNTLLLLLAWVHILGRHLPIHHVAPTASIIGAHPLLRATLLFHIKIYINIYYFLASQVHIYIYIYRHAILLYMQQKPGGVSN